MADKLESYLIAGARLTGCRVSHNVTGGLNITLPGNKHEYVGDRDRHQPMRVRAENGAASLRAEVSTRRLLDAWQPDMASGVSRQHYIDTGHYLPVAADAADTGEPGAARCGCGKELDNEAENGVCRDCLDLTDLAAADLQDDRRQAEDPDGGRGTGESSDHPSR